MLDTNVVVRKYLADNAGVKALVNTRVYCPRLPENAALPAIGLFVRGGTSTPYIPDIPSPSYQIDCWGADPITARGVYRAVYDALQGIQYKSVTIADTTYVILSAIEEVQGQDIVDNDISGYFRVLSFWQIILR